jgi:RNA polymerase sigma factor (sigma-70 family)
MSTKEVAIEQAPEVDYSDVVISYANAKIPENPEDIVIQKEILTFVVDTIKQIHNEYPDKEYLDIYVMRYEQGMTQKEIAQELGISQSEVSKRLYKLMEKVRSIID